MIETQNKMCTFFDTQMISIEDVEKIMDETAESVEYQKVCIEKIVSRAGL